MKLRTGKPITLGRAPRQGLRDSFFNPAGFGMPLISTRGILHKSLHVLMAHHLRYPPFKLMRDYLGRRRSPDFRNHLLPSFA